MMTKVLLMISDDQGAGDHGDEGDERDGLSDKLSISVFLALAIAAQCPACPGGRSLYINLLALIA